MPEKSTCPLRADEELRRVLPQRPIDTAARRADGDPCWRGLEHQRGDESLIAIVRQDLRPDAGTSSERSSTPRRLNAFWKAPKGLQIQPQLLGQVERLAGGVIVAPRIMLLQILAALTRARGSGMDHGLAHRGGDRRGAGESRPSPPTMKVRLPAFAAAMPPDTRATMA